MNIFLWILQVLMAFHTGVGAFWKFSNSEQTIPSLQALPHAVWMALSGIEIICSLCLLLPLVYKKSNFLVPIAATFIAIEMALFIVLHLFSGEKDHSQMMYWLVVGAIGAFIAFGRTKIRPL